MSTTCIAHVPGRSLWDCECDECVDLQEQAAETVAPWYCDRCGADMVDGEAVDIAFDGEAWCRPCREFGIPHF